MIKKNLGMILRVSMMVTMVLLFFGAWSIQWQETINSQVFWDDNRIVAGIGFVFAVLGWIFWETYVVSKTRKVVLFIGAIVKILAGTIMINGILGLTGGLLSLAIISASFYLNQMKIVSLRGQTA